MHAIKRMIYSTVAVTTMLVATVLFASTANAAPYTNAPTLSVSTSNPAVGATFTVAGADFVAGTTVDLTLHTQTYDLGTATVDAGGSFTTTVTLPAGVSGTHTLTATDPAGNTVLNASLTIVIGADNSGGGSNGAGSAGNGSSNGNGSGAGNGALAAGGGNGGLAYTGVPVTGIVVVGLLLLLAGFVTLLTSRRRKTSLQKPIA